MLRRLSSTRVKNSMGKLMPDPRYGNNVLDSCVLGTPGEEYEAAARILELADKGEISAMTTYGVINEISNPSTPQHVKDIANQLIFSISVKRTIEEQKKYEAIHQEMTGNGKPGKYAADANHIFEAGKYGKYFITNDERIIKRREKLNHLSGVFIVRPSEWIKAYEDNASTTYTRR